MPCVGFRTRVVGADAFRITGALLGLAEGEGGGAQRSHTMHTPGENPLDSGPRTYAALETACLDLIGRSLGVPLCEMLGGRAQLGTVLGVRVLQARWRRWRGPRCAPGQVRRMPDARVESSAKCAP